MDRLIIDSNVLIAFGKLAVSQALITNARIELVNLLDLHDRLDTKYDKKTLAYLKRAMKGLEESEFTISDALFDITDNYLKHHLKENNND